MKSYIVTRNVSLWKTWGPLRGSVNFVGVEINVKLKIAQRQTQFHWISIPTTTEKDITVRLQDQAYITWSVLWSLTAVNMYVNNTYENIVRTPFICGKKLNFFFFKTPHKRTSWIVFHKSHWNECLSKCEKLNWTGNFNTFILWTLMQGKGVMCQKFIIGVNRSVLNRIIN